jgi:hypothetical protein
MAGKRGSTGENSKKAAGQARKAETAANKKAAKEREAEAAESSTWQKGAKDTSKKYVGHITYLELQSSFLTYIPGKH